MDAEDYVYFTIWTVLTLAFMAVLFHGDALIAWRRETTQCKRENEVLKRAVLYLYGYARTCGVDADDLRERFGIEIEQR